MNGKRPRIVIVDSLDGLPADIEWVAVDFPNVTSKEQAERMARRDDLCPHGLRMGGAFCVDCAGASPSVADAFAYMAGANPYARRQERRGFDDLDDRLMREGFYPSGRVYEQVRRERAAVEIITDPNDRRGFDARPIGAA